MTLPTVIVHQPGGLRRVSHGPTGLGEVQVTDTYQAIFRMTDRVTTYMLTLREVTLDGRPVLNPNIAALLAADAGIGEAPVHLGPEGL